MKIILINNTKKYIILNFTLYKLSNVKNNPDKLAEINE